MQIQQSGVRRLRTGALAARAQRVPDGEIVSRKGLITAAREACQALDLRPSVRLILGELAGCYGEQGLARGLMVWPSNAYLERKTGLAPRTIRKCVGELVRVALIEPVDSANRKRFAIRSEDGTIIDAFGFNLTPIYARRLEFAALVMQQKRAEEALGRQFDEITINRKACEEALRALVSYRADVSLGEYETRFEALSALTPRRSMHVRIDELVSRWIDLRQEFEALFLVDSEPKESGNGGTSCRHKEQDNGQSSDPYNGTCGEKAGEPAAVGPMTVGFLVEACPALLAYDPSIRSEAQVITAGCYLRSSIGAHPSAWDEAVEALGIRGAAILVIYVLQLHEDDTASGAGRINNPGGLFRSYIRRMASRDFDLSAALKALRRRHMG